MRRIILVLLIMQVSLVQHGQIIADHTVVDKFKDIPQSYIDEVKKMLLLYSGQSHALGLIWGLNEFEKYNPKFKCDITTSEPPEAYTTLHLRAASAMWGELNSSAGWYYDTGEQEWFTNEDGISRMKAGITYCNISNLRISAIGFGWCWDMIDGSPSAGTDPVTGNHWYGASLSGPANWQIQAWGLNAADFAATSNPVCMDTYLSATQSYIDYCKSKGYSTKVFFTTGPVDNDGGRIGNEALYQGYLKHEYIRDYVKADATRILFDYADILCYNNDVSQATATWNGHTFPAITSLNVTPINMGHISDIGNIRLAKAMWWMLARIAGWDGGTTRVDDLKDNSGSDILIEMSKEEVNIRLADTYLDSTMSLFNLSGSLIATKKVVKNNLSFSTSSLPAGIYFIVISGSNITKTQKIIIS